MNIWTVEALWLVIVLVLPGLVSMQVYRLIMPAYRIEWGNALLEGLFYGVINLVLLSPIVYFMQTAGAIDDYSILFWISLIVVFAIGPVVWPIAFTYLVKRPIFRKYIQLPYPSAWDYYFSKREPAFILIHLNDGTMIGGYYGPGSYATSFPTNGGLYLEAVYRVEEDGTFGEPVDSTDGLLVGSSEYRYIEFFRVPDASPADLTSNSAS